MINSYCCTSRLKLNKFKLDRLNQLDMFETVQFHVWHNFQTLSQVNDILSSKTWVLMSFKISSKVFFGVMVCDVKWTCCLLITNLLIGSGKLAQFKWNGLFKSTDACNVESLPCNSLMVWTKEPCNCSCVHQSTIVFAFIGFCSLKVDYSSA